MDMMKLCGASLIAALTALTLRQLKPGFGLVAAMAGGVVMASLLLPPLAEVLAGLSGVARLGGLDTVPGYPVAEVSRCGRWASVRMIDPVTDELSRTRMA